MCEFFSFDSDGNGKFLYFNHEIRKRILLGDLQGKYKTDSHTSIADYHGYKGNKEDKLNKYEYNPLTKKFSIDQLNTTDDSSEAKKWVQSLDFSTIVPELIIKPSVNPLKVVRDHKVTEEEIGWLQEWKSVWSLVGDSVWDSVWSLVGDSVVGYLSSFVNIKYAHDFSSATKLWEAGLAPSFDGKTWRLHAGENAEVVFQTILTEEKK